jgi:hypothetical protein
MATMALRASVVALALLVLTVRAEPAREIGWEDLVGVTEAFDDPYEKLSPDQLFDLALVARLREERARGNTEVPEKVAAEVDQAERRLVGEGVDIDGLLARREEITEKRRAQSEAVNASLDGQNVRIPGYLLPLEYQGKQVTEFLLVPYVGACIHVPPPPPNQIVHVRPGQAVDDPGTFAPVWVDGIIKAQRRETELSLVDGAASVPVSYSLSARTVEPYDP